MVELEQQFSKDFLEIFEPYDWNIVDTFIETTTENAMADSKTVDCWDCYLRIENVSQLNDIYHYTFKKEDSDIEVNVSYAIGIDGCGMIQFSFDGSSMLKEPLVIEVFSHIEIDWDEACLYFKVKNKSELSKQQVQRVESLFNRHKDDIETLIRKSNYDSDMTGSSEFGLNPYKEDFQKFREIGVFWDKVYEDTKVVRNI